MRHSTPARQATSPSARTVDDRLGEDRLASRLALDDDAFDGVAVFNDIHAEDVHQHLDADLLQHLQRHGLRLFGVDDRQAHMELAGTVFAGGAPRTQAVDEELGQSFDNLVALASEITQNRQTDGQVAAQIAAAFDQHDAQALACRRTCGHDARGAAAHDEHVHFGANRNLPPEFRNRFFLICHICNVLRFILRFWVFRGVPCATG